MICVIKCLTLYSHFMSVYLQDSEFPVDNRVNPQLSHHKGPSAHLTRSGGFRLTHTVTAHALPVSG